MSLEDFFKWANELGYRTDKDLAEKMDFSRRTIFRHRHGEIQDIRYFRDRAVFVFGDVVRKFFSNTANVVNNDQDNQEGQS